MEHASPGHTKYTESEEQRLIVLRQRLRELNEECVRVVEEIDALAAEPVSAVCILSET
jgi:hypothetical protein